LKNKYYFLHLLKDDLKNISKNYDKDFLALKNVSQRLTYNLSEKNKILNIYNYVIKNLSYSKIVDFTNYKIFSGIEAYKNKD
jgi:hypothetical protein